MRVRARVCVCAWGKPKHIIISCGVWKTRQKRGTEGEKERERVCGCKGECGGVDTWEDLVKGPGRPPQKWRTRAFGAIIGTCASPIFSIGRLPCCRLRSGILLDVLPLNERQRERRMDASVMTERWKLPPITLSVNRHLHYRDHPLASGGEKNQKQVVRRRKRVIREFLQVHRPIRSFYASCSSSSSFFFVSPPLGSGRSCLRRLHSSGNFGEKIIRLFLFFFSFGFAFSSLVLICFCFRCTRVLASGGLRSMTLCGCHVWVLCLSCLLSLSGRGCPPTYTKTLYVNRPP